MKYFDLVLATFAGLALAAPQDAVVKPTAEEYVGHKSMPLQRVLDIYKGYPIHCNQYEPNKLSCSAPWSRKAEDKDPNAVNELSPLCEEKGGCTNCRYDTDQDRGAGEETFTCETPISEDCKRQMSAMFQACRQEKGSTFEACNEKALQFGNSCKSE